MMFGNKKNIALFMMFLAPAIYAEDTCYEIRDDNGNIADVCVKQGEKIVEYLAFEMIAPNVEHISNTAYQILESSIDKIKKNLHKMNKSDIKENIKFTFIKIFKIHSYEFYRVQFKEILFGVVIKNEHDQLASQYPSLTSINKRKIDILRRKVASFSASYISSLSIELASILIDEISEELANRVYHEYIHESE